MKSGSPKVLHEVLGVPMLQHVLDAVSPLKAQKTIVVIGNKAEEVKKRFRDRNLTFVLQKKLLGTGDALSVACREIKGGTVLVLNGDGPLITTKTLRNLLSRHKSSKNILSFLSFIDDSMKGYGRVMRDTHGCVTGIVEDKHASRLEQEKNKELNGGVYAIESRGLDYLKKVKRNDVSGEYYLTDLIAIMSKAGRKVNAYNCPQEEVRGVNDRVQLFEVTDVMRKRIIAQWMAKGVTFLDPQSSVVHSSVTIGGDSVIYPNTYLEGHTSIGANCIIYPGVRIVDSRIKKQVTVKDSSLIEESIVGEGASVGPFAHLRPQSTIGKNAKIGNFVEIKKSDIGDGTKASHLSYLGDAVIGSDVNIGAGTITCNYDGKNKYKTVIKSGVFIGSDSQLVAPVEIGRGAYVAAGATVTNNVPAGSLAISRQKQVSIKDWAKKREKIQNAGSRVRKKKKS
jgi:bifunctional UDP-N-acetylglucosamine pyrophosphorylase/glucosamine-1-phosphate N-acetyltransferase